MLISQLHSSFWAASSSLEYQSPNDVVNHLNVNSGQFVQIVNGLAFYLELWLEEEIQESK